MPQINVMILHIQVIIVPALLILDLTHLLLLIMTTTVSLAIVDSTILLKIITQQIHCGMDMDVDMICVNCCTNPNMPWFFQQFVVSMND